MQQGQKRVGAQPCVGIFWIFGGKIILDTTPLHQAEPYGEAMTHPRGHLQKWTELRRRGAVSPDFEFEDSPRGRVEYIPKENQFVIYVDRCILVRKHFIRLIMAEMNLPPERTKTSSDEHYHCLHCPCD